MSAPESKKISMACIDQILRRWYVYTEQQAEMEQIRCRLARKVQRRAAAAGAGEASRAAAVDTTVDLVRCLASQPVVAPSPGGGRGVATPNAARPGVVLCSRCNRPVQADCNWVWMLLIVVAALCGVIGLQLF